MFNTGTVAKLTTLFNLVALAKVLISFAVGYSKIIQISIRNFGFGMAGIVMGNWKRGF